MLADRYDLLLSTASSTARDAYVQGCERLLTMYPGAIEAFDRAIAADPGFALAHAGRTQVLLGRGNINPALEALAAAKAQSAGLSAREVSHIAFFELFAAGHADAAIAALRVHLASWPRDALVLTTTAFTNGLIGSSGRADVKRTLIGLLDSLAPSYGDDWWFMAHHAMALSEDGQRDAARMKIERSISQNPHNAWVAHARTHLCYEDGDPAAARAFLASWLTTYPRDGLLYSHLSWHLALSDLEAGNEAEALRLYKEAFSLDVHSGAPRAKVTDAVSFLWRWELAGYSRDTGAWRTMHDFAASALPRAGAALADLHVALTQAVMGDGVELEARARQMENLARDGRYPSGPFVPALSRAFVAFERRDFSAVISALEPIVRESERLGGSRAQLDLVEFTLLKAYLNADQLGGVRRLLSERRPGPSGIPVAGLDLVY
ncbi:MAG: tetratricopeptide repeat protein [Acetobacteraceae bacterium]|nr:tetratricopeptide repeat protein [Acetobacteraceae bacterium]